MVFRAEVVFEFDLGILRLVSLENYFGVRNGCATFEGAVPHFLKFLVVVLC